MATGIAGRLQIKPGMRVLLLNAPASASDALRADAPDAMITDDLPPDSTETFDVVHLFVKDSADLARYYHTARRTLHDADSLFWISYPKKSAGIETDLSRDEGWALITGDGWQGVRQIAIDAIWSAVRFRRVAAQSDAAIIDAQYAGAKTALRPLYDQLVELLRGFGSDVRLDVRKSYVAAARRKHFAAIQPTTRTRLDVALKLRSAPFSERVQPNNGVGGGALTHKVAVESPDAIDDALIQLLRAAYEQNP